MADKPKGLVERLRERSIFNQAQQRREREAGLRDVNEDKKRMPERPSNGRPGTYNDFFYPTKKK